MSRFAWDHNAYYHRTLLRTLPAAPGRVLDVGCGAGALATALAARSRHVDALDRAPEMIAAAERAVPGNVRCVHADFLRDTHPGAAPAGHYDAVVSVSALHHMPLSDALPRMANALRPGGVLAAIALPRTDLPRELPVELAAFAAQRVLAATFAVARTVGRGRWYAPEHSHDAMPVVLDPPLTTRQVRARAAAILPGARVRRLLFWRYLLVWHKPGG
ncbi:methyltransferase family protein [Prauserella shujinwangii]|uniref:Methyltransferase family protein n=1 Tax=Prauserella shujinwangii TaxID=1453103 RepID=A0A2T0LKF8_9PSEU|nr:class I SAM-dependent methyltransferase [Prauserella shujinwangii]PRX43389.1 methyltransferase family protein [Prauserella shujinwangii]